MPVWWGELAVKEYFIIYLTVYILHTLFYKGMSYECPGAFSETAGVLHPELHYALCADKERERERDIYLLTEQRLFALLHLAGIFLARRRAARCRGRSRPF